MKNLVVVLISVLFFFGCASSTMKKDEVQQDVTQSIKTKKKHWVFSFKDRTLIDFLKEARKNNLDLQAAAANVEKVVAMANQAGAGLKPQLDLGVQSNSGNAPFTPGGLATGQLSWEVDLWGRMKSAESAAR